MSQIFKIWRVQPLGPPQNMWKKGLKRSITSVWYIVSRLCDSITSVWVSPNWFCQDNCYQRNHRIFCLLLFWKIAYYFWFMIASCIVLFIVKTQRNSTQLNSTQSNCKSNCKSNFVGLDIVATWNPHHPPHPTINFSVASRPARELKFGTDTH